MTIQGLLAIICVELLVVQPYASAQQQPPLNQQMPANTQQSPPPQTLSPAQLDSLVAPIALYPDPILSQILVASTYPLEIVEAARWLSQNSSLQGKPLVDAAAKQSWDASVQALVVLPDVLKRLNQEITWTSDLGNAFLAQQQDVMEAVQRMRQKAESKGALQSNKEQQVTTATQGGNTYIEIQPASPELVYVPQYDPAAVWGPPVDYPYPPIYYPPSTGAVIAAGAISFGLGVAVGAIWSGGWGGWGWGCGWGRNNVVINNNFISSNHFNRTNVANGNNWVHNPAHRGGVPYNNRNVANRFNAAQRNVNARPTVAQTQQRLNQSSLGQRPGNGARPSQGNLGPRPAAAQGNFKPPAGGDRVGNRSVGGGGGNGGAFGGMNQGGNRAQMNSSRGFSSGGGFHGGGGGRGGGGRGGGGRRR